MHSVFTLCFKEIQSTPHLGELYYLGKGSHDRVSTVPMCQLASITFGTLIDHTYAVLTLLRSLMSCVSGLPRLPSSARGALKETRYISGQCY